MTTTPVWVPLVVAFLGLGGVLAAQLVANHREDVRWRRERERENTTWGREDAARSYEHRRNAYVDFVKIFHDRWRVFVLAQEAAKVRNGDNDAPIDFLEPLYDRLVQIQVFGTKEAEELAQNVLNTIANYVYHDINMPRDVLKLLLSEIRRDLSIPDRPA